MSLSQTHLANATNCNMYKIDSSQYHCDDVQGGKKDHVHARAIGPFPGQLILPILQGLHLTFDMLVWPAFLRWQYYMLHVDAKSVTMHAYVPCVSTPGNIAATSSWWVFGHSTCVMNRPLEDIPYTVQINVSYDYLIVPCIEYSKPHDDWVTGLSMLFRVVPCMFLMDAYLMIYRCSLIFINYTNSCTMY